MWGVASDLSRSRHARCANLTPRPVRLSRCYSAPDDQKFRAIPRHGGRGSFPALDRERWRNRTVDFNESAKNLAFPQ